MSWFLTAARLKAEAEEIEHTAKLESQNMVCMRLDKYKCIIVAKIYVVGPPWKCVGEGLLMSTTRYVFME